MLFFSGFRQHIPLRAHAMRYLVFWMFTCPLLAVHASELLSLNEALDLAAKHAPQIDAQTASLNAAMEEAIRAPQLPDPKLIAGIENLPIDTADRFSMTRDFMTMRKIGLMQELPRKQKRRLRGEAAEADVEKERGQLIVERLNVRREAAMAWIERYLAERERELLLDLRKESDLVVATSEAALRGGKGSGGDVLAARSDRAQLDDRLDASARDVAQAQASLARWIGPQADRALAEPPDFAELGVTPQALMAVGAHAALLPFVSMEARAMTDVALARAEKTPDWSVELAYAQRGPAYSNMVSVEFRIDLPLFTAHRQDPAIAAKLAQLDHVRAEREEAERVHREQTTKLLATWTTARKRLARTSGELLPLGKQRVAVTLASYRGGHADLQAVIAARAAEIDASMMYVTRLGELARAWAALNFLISDEERP